ncbi:hypothetical protein [Texcoconibacillus texcoconensis]|uniref:Putative membrane protein n=1 Tax=Texcoconibacillus texcoconensis TaxID=1095777 RepID=A0A840QU98_9BACI|nr:hypothetical protein [Texcoconibacillus texcoconensis]MBB5175102.1 putative membrane protein [Texcoconibacillus texcoconensis]
MALSDLPSVKPPKGVIFASGVALATLMFFYTGRKDEDAQEASKNSD